MLINIPHIVLLNIVNNLSDLDDVYQLKLTCSYLNSFINKYKDLLRSKKSIMYRTLYGLHDISIEVSIYANYSGTYYIKNIDLGYSYSYCDSDYFSISGDIKDNKITTAYKIYNGRTFIWEIQFIDGKLDNVDLCNSTDSVADFGDTPIDFRDAYKSITWVLKGWAILNYFTTKRIL